MRSKNIALRLAGEIERIPGGITSIAKHLGKARNTIYNWCDKGNIPADQLVQLQGLGVDVLYVISGQRAPHGAESGSGRAVDGIASAASSAVSDSGTSRREACEEILSFIEHTLSKAETKAKPRPVSAPRGHAASMLHEPAATYDIRSSQLPPAVMAIGRLFFDLLHSLDDAEEQRAVMKALTGSDALYRAYKSTGR